MAFVLAIGITIAVIGWGYLVYLAILHGQDIRAGDESAWQMVLASGLGAVLCLFAGFMLIARLFRLLGRTPPEPETLEATASTHAGGRRIRSEES